MLKIQNLHSEIENKKVINGLNLEIMQNEIHVIMGPNGSGKSSLANVIAGNEKYKITKGDIKFNGKVINKTLCDIRAKLGIFLSFQNPYIIEGLTFATLLKHSVNEIRKANNEKELSVSEYFKLINEYCNLLKIDPKSLDRSVNLGFSGGEKKKMEILQMLMLNPKLLILDELDSGLDIDALKTTTDAINLWYKKEGKSILLITHYTKILNYIKPDFIHIFANGKIIKTGNIELCETLEKNGYDFFIKGKK